MTARLMCPMPLWKQRAEVIEVVDYDDRNGRRYALVTVKGRDRWRLVSELVVTGVSDGDGGRRS